jgi:hypothetical protein
MLARRRSHIVERRGRKEGGREAVIRARHAMLRRVPLPDERITSQQTRVEHRLGRPTTQHTQWCHPPAPINRGLVSWCCRQLVACLVGLYSLSVRHFITSTAGTWPYEVRARDWSPTVALKQAIWWQPSSDGSNFCSIYTPELLKWLAYYSASVRMEYTTYSMQLRVFI